VDRYDRCLEHLDNEELDAFLAWLSEGVLVDVRGTRMTRQLLDRILDAVPLTADGRPILRSALFTRVEFVEDISFAEIEFRDRASFEEARFKGAADFQETRFGGKANFRGATFEQRTSFREALFDQQAIFESARFVEDVLFDSAVFKTDVSFQNASFSTTGSFRRCRFEGQASFEGVTCKIPLVFTHSRFAGEALFDSSQLRKKMPVLQDARFSEAPIFGGSVPPGVVFDIRPAFTKVVQLAEPSEQKPGPHAVLAFITWVLQHQAALLAVFGILIYAIVREAHDGFYSALGVAAEEVGLNYAILVGRAALGLITYLAILAALVVLWFLLVMRPRSAEEVQALVLHSRWAPPLFVVGSILAFAAPLVVFTRQENPRAFLFRLDSYDVWFFGSVIVVLVLGTLIIVPPIYDLISAVPIRGIMLLALFLIALAFSSLVFANRWGAFRAEEVERGFVVRPTPLFGILSAQAQPVCVYWTDKHEEVEQLRNPLLYLGQANSTLVLYDLPQAVAPFFFQSPRARPILRIPSSKVVLMQADARVRSVRQVICSPTLRALPQPRRQPPPTHPPPTSSSLPTTL
jgi:hypothetical protein